MVITVSKSMKIGGIDEDLGFKYNGKDSIERYSVFMDLEHYIYKVPLCIGVFGACVYDHNEDMLHLTQYMIESEEDKIPILNLTYEYLKKFSQVKKYMVTFSGNNDFGVIEYLFKENNIDFNIRESFVDVDLQREYEKINKVGVGLKNLEKELNIEREGEVLTGFQLAKIIRDIGIKGKPCPNSLSSRILSYNEYDVVNLFKILNHWTKIMNKS